jgi:hypothetical protein
MKYDVVLIEKPFFEGISFLEIKSLFNLLLTDEVYPIEIQSNCESSAMGFITSEAADKIDYAYETNTYFANFITDILDDMKNESEDHIYKYRGLKIWLGR